MKESVTTFKRSENVTYINEHGSVSTMDTLAMWRAAMLYSRLGNAPRAPSRHRLSTPARRLATMGQIEIIPL